ncbi:MAG: glycosyltransferase family 39 protein [Candidatus Auribacterota bacterium]
MKKYLFLMFIPLFIWITYIDFYYIKSQLYFISYPYHLETGEGYVLFQTRQIAQGIFPYGEIGNKTYLINNYPPLFHLISALITPLFNAPYAPGRIITFLSTIGICLMLGLICHIVTGNIIISILSGISFPAIPLLFWSQRFYRVDGLAIFLSFLGAYMFIRWLKHGSKVSFYISLLSFMLAVYTKHNSVYAPVAAMITLFFA